MARRLIPFLILLLLLSLAAGTAAAQPAARLDLRSVDVAFPQITVDLRVRDGAGKDVLGLPAESFRIVEDGTRPINSFELSSVVADTSTPTRTVVLGDGNSETIYAVGSTIGVVFDATTLLNDKATGRDYVSEGRRAVEQFLLKTGALAPVDPEVVSLFIPAEEPTQDVQPDEFEAFTYDRNAVINYLRRFESRSGRTSLYAAIELALLNTIKKAGERGSPALLLVVSDGADSISGSRFDALVGQARENGVKIITFGIGGDASLTDQQGGFRLKELSSMTGGLYYQRPDDAMAQQAFDESIETTPAGLYTLRFSSGLIDDGKCHFFTIEAQLPQGSVSSEQVQFCPQLKQASRLETTPSQALMRHYMPLAVPGLLLSSVVVVVVMGGLRSLHTRSSINRKRTNKG